MTVTADSLRTDLERELYKRLAGRAKALTPETAADTALTVVLPHLRAMHAEIYRLRGVLTEWVLTGKTGSEGKDGT